jgi:hypothetical protein
MTFPIHNAQVLDFTIPVEARFSAPQARVFYRVSYPVSTINAKSVGDVEECASAKVICAIPKALPLLSR